MLTAAYGNVLGLRQEPSTTARSFDRMLLDQKTKLGTIVRQEDLQSVFIAGLNARSRPLVQAFLASSHGPTEMEVLISAASAADPREFRPTAVFSPGRSVDRGSSLLTHDSLSSPLDSFHSDQFGDDKETNFSEESEQEIVLTILDQTRQGNSFALFAGWKVI
jgi:hypothetical protein